jgi:hypothetical protein
MLSKEGERTSVIERDTGRTDVIERDEVVVDERSRKRVRGGPPLVRALFTLAGAAAAGFLVWLASLFELGDAEEFWLAMGLVAAGGLVLGLSQLFGGWTKWGMPVLSPGVFFLAFVPAALAVGWILLATQPDGAWQQERLAGWSDDVGILGFVQDVAPFAPALALGLGLLLSFSFDTTGPRKQVERHETVVPDEDVHDYEGRGVTAPLTADESAPVRDREEETLPAGTVEDESAPWDRRRV